MKTFYQSLLVAIITLSLFLTDLTAQTPKLYITLVSHNEDNIGYDVSSALYYNNRNTLVNICNMLQTKGVEYNYGGDWVALEAIANLDTGTVITNTNGKNILRWMVEDKGFECDPHSHESTRNYADVHYLMSQLGFIPSNTMSGFLYDTLQSGNCWDAYQNGVSGIYFPSHTWNPEVLWGAATFQHQNDPYFFGLYNPDTLDNFFQHNPSNNLTVIGVGCPLKIENTTSIGYADSLIDNIVTDIQVGNLPSYGIYTQEIFFSEGDINQPWFMPLLNKVIDSVNVHVANGTVEWKNLTDIYNLWQTNFNSEPFAYDCNRTYILDVEENTVIDNPEPVIYPNPSDGYFTLSFQYSLKNASLVLFNSMGQSLIQMNNLNGEKIVLSHHSLPAGIYFVRLTQKNKTIANEKLVILN